MHSKIVLAATLLASVVSAENFMVHEQRKRSYLEARATATSGGDGLTGDCATAVMSVYTGIPTPPAQIIKDLTENPQTDPCHFTTPASLSKQYASYSSEIMSWYSDHSKEIENLTSECPALSKYASMVPVCSTAAGGTEAKATDSSSSDSSSSDSSSTGSSSSASSTPAAGKSDATRTTGMAAVAMAAAGFVVALL